MANGPPPATGWATSVPPTRARIVIIYVPTSWASNDYSYISGSTIPLPSPGSLLPDLDTVARLPRAPQLELEQHSPRYHRPLHNRIRSPYLGRLRMLGLDIRYTPLDQRRSSQPSPPPPAWRAAARRRRMSA